MTNLTDYIAINHPFMTVKEMSEETGVPEPTIRSVCYVRKWKAISQTDRIREYIQDHKGGVIEDIAEKFKVAPKYIGELAKKQGIELITKKEADKQEELNKNRSTLSFMHKVFNEAADGSGARILEKLLQEPSERKPVKRISEPYTQSGSPYGIADQIRKVKIK